jgi:hypothetical protein
MGIQGWPSRKKDWLSHVIVCPRAFVVVPISNGLGVAAEACRDISSVNGATPDLAPRAKPDAAATGCEEGMDVMDIESAAEDRI